MVFSIFSSGERKRGTQCNAPDIYCSWRQSRANFWSVSYLEIFSYLIFISIWQYFIWSGVKIQVTIEMDYDGIDYNHFNTIQFMDRTRGKCCPYKILSLIFFAHFVNQTKRQLFFSSFENFSTITQRKGKLSMTDEGK